MAVSKVRSENIRLAATRKALDKIRDPGIKEDLERFISGAEVCLEYHEVHLAFDAVRTVVTSVIALNRTISPKVTAAVLDGLLEDSENGATALQRGLGFTKNRNSKCDIVSGSGPGTSTCVSKRNSTCYTLDSGSGCGGTSGFQFVWEVAL